MDAEIVFFMLSAIYAAPFISKEMSVIFSVIFCALGMFVLITS